MERDFRTYLGRSPQEEIRRSQISKARELLLSTELPVDRVSDSCGFKNPAYFYVVFKQLEGTTPANLGKPRPGKMSQ
ncbi:MAG: helix-turn-helix transcriptional regulator [Planctomycetota bacterium]